MEKSFNKSFSGHSITDTTQSHTSFHPTLSSFTSLDQEIYKQTSGSSKSVYKPSKVLLFKGIPDNASEMELLTICQKFGVIKDILIARHKRYAFILFEAVEQAIQCYESFTKFPPAIRGLPLYAHYTGKDLIIKPNSLIGPPSRFLLMVLENPPINFDPSFIAMILRPYGKCLQIIPFQTKTFQIFVEMEDVIQAINAKESLDGKIVFNNVHCTIFYSEEKDLFSEKENYPSAHRHHHHHPKYVSQSLPETTSFQQKQFPAPGLGPGSYFQNPYYSHQQQQQAFEAPRSHIPTPEKVQSTMNILTPLVHAKEEKSSKILMVKNLPKDVSARMLFRLFGAYGNVLKVKIFFKNPENALIEFQDEFQANLAKANLNNCPLLGNNIFVTNSKEGIVVDVSGLKKETENHYMGDYMNSTEHRYKFVGSKNYSNIVAPSRVLHLSNLCADKDEGFYFDLFKKFGYVKKFIFLKGDEKMALMEMSTLAEAVNILINFHNFNINGKFLKVSFSKYPQIKELK